MKRIRISTTQYENRSGDKEYNLSRVDFLSEKAADEGSDIIAFHECSLTGYTFALHHSKNEMLDLAEFIPEGQGVRRLTQIAAKNNECTGNNPFRCKYNFHAACYHFPRSTLCPQR